MYSVDEKTIKAYKEKLEVMRKPLPEVFEKNKELIKDYLRGDYTYDFSDDRHSYRAGHQYHELLKERFTVVINNSVNEEAEMLKRVIDVYNCPHRCELVPELAHPSLRKGSGFYYKEEFIDSIGLGKLEITLEEMRAMAERIKAILELVKVNHPTHSLVYTSVPHAKLRTMDDFNRYMACNVRLVNPAIIEMLDVLLTKDNMRVLKAINLWRKHVSIMGGAEFFDEVAVSINHKPHDLEFSAIHFSYKNFSIGAIVDQKLTEE